MKTEKLKQKKNSAPKEEKSGQGPIILFGNINPPPPWEGGGGGGGWGGGDPFPGGDPGSGGSGGFLHSKYRFKVMSYP
jgi:hypothetical protein